MNSFRDPVTNVLKGWGFCTSNAPGDLVRVEVDDFNLDPKAGWQLVVGSWVPYTPPTPIPQVVTPLQAKLALNQAGLLTQVQNAVNTADIATQLAWSNALTFERNSPFILNMATRLGLSPTQIDQLFLSAASFT